MFIETATVIAKMWKQSKCPPSNEGINWMYVPYNGILYVNKKEVSTDVYHSIDEP